MLARWSGWGAVPKVFDPQAGEFADERGQLQAMLADDEYAAARRNVLNAHYTDASLVQPVWHALERLGLDRGQVLEPGCGVGTFLGFAPDQVQGTGIELDPTTARMAALTYPEHRVLAGSFADVHGGDDAFDAAIGNVPFSRARLHDPGYNDAHYPMHTHFLLKSLRMTRPGGLVGVWISRWMLDGQDTAARSELAELADLVTAVRTPAGAHAEAAGTDVVTDFVLLRRRPAGQDPDTSTRWLRTPPMRDVAEASSDADAELAQVAVNEYFLDNPDHVLGSLDTRMGRFGPELTVHAHTGVDLSTSLQRVLGADVEQAAQRGWGLDTDQNAAAPPEITLGRDLHQRFEGTLATGDDGTFTRWQAGRWQPHEVPKTQSRELRELIELRETVQALLAAENATSDDTSDIAELRGELNQRYDAYAARYGPINRFSWRAQSKPGWSAFTAWCRQHEHTTLPAEEPVIMQYLEHLVDAGCDQQLLQRHFDAIHKRHTAREQPLTDDLLTRAQGLIDSCRAEPAAGLDLEALGLTSYTRKTPPQGGFRTDPFSSLVRALEVFDPTSQQADKADIFHRRVVQPVTTPTRADSAVDAVSISLTTHAELRLDVVADLLGLDGPEQAQQTLTSGETPLAFLDPDTRTVVVRNDYLSGDVRAKLAAAEDAASADPTFNGHVQALRAVVPTDLGPDEIEVQLGSWIQADYVQQFLRELLGDNTQVAHHDRFWSVQGGNPNSTAARDTWGTPHRSAQQLVLATLTGRQIRVTFQDSDGTVHTDAEATEAAKNKAAELSERFRDWVWEDPTRAEHIVRVYNQRFNAHVPRSYDDIELTTPGLASHIKLRPHQKAAIAAMIFQPSFGLWHEVGAGKTLEMIAGAMERKRLGLVEKQVVNIPNHMLEQFEREWLQAYPQAKLLVASSEELSGTRRRDFIARAMTGNYDAVILTEGAFKALPVSPEAEERFIAAEVDAITNALAEARTAGAHERTIKELEERQLQAQEAAKGKLAGLRRDPGVSWEDLGFDSIIVDESQRFKNSRRFSGLPDMGHPGADRSVDLDMKLGLLTEQFGHARYTSATATPFTNSLAEIYTELRRLGAEVEDLDTWARTWGELMSTQEMTPGGGFKEMTRLRKLINVPELAMWLRLHADIRTAEHLQLPVPEITDGGPQAIAVPPSNDLVAFNAELARRYKEIKPRPEKGDDNHLSLIGLGTQAALDMRLVGREPDEPQKVDLLADRIAQRYQDNKDNTYLADDETPHPTPGALQVVFCSVSTPDPNRWNFYDELRTQLTSRGVPEHLVRFIHEAPTDQKRAELFAAARSGDVAVLIGSSEKMGTGTNVQTRAIGLYQVSPPWRADTVHQEAGRVVRQGNQNSEVFVERWTTEQSLEAKKWQVVLQKWEAFRPLMTGEIDRRIIEMPDEDTDHYAELMAMASGDGRVRRKAALESEVNRLTRLHKAWARQQTSYQVTVSGAEDKIPKLTAQVDQLDQAIAARTDTSGAQFAMTLQGTRHTERVKAAAHLAQLLTDAVADTPQHDTRDMTLGRLGGIEVRAQIHRWLKHTVSLHLTSGIPGEIKLHHRDAANSHHGLITRLENWVAGLDNQRDTLTEQITTLQSQAEQARPLIGTPFAQQAELDEATAQLAQLNAELSNTTTGAVTSPDGLIAAYQARLQDETVSEALHDRLRQVLAHADPRPSSEAFDQPDPQRLLVEATSGLAAVASSDGQPWTVFTVGTALTIPLDPLTSGTDIGQDIRPHTREQAQAFLAASERLRDADGTPPPLHSPEFTPAAAREWRDYEGRTLPEAMRAVLLPAYLDTLEMPDAAEQVRARFPTEQPPPQPAATPTAPDPEAAEPPPPPAPASPVAASAPHGQQPAGEATTAASPVGENRGVAIGADGTARRFDVPTGPTPTPADPDSDSAEQAERTTPPVMAKEQAQQLADSALSLQDLGLDQASTTPLRQAAWWLLTDSELTRTANDDVTEQDLHRAIHEQAVQDLVLLIGHADGQLRARLSDDDSRQQILDRLTQFAASHLRPSTSEDTATSAAPVATNATPQDTPARGSTEPSPTDSVATGPATMADDLADLVQQHELDLSPDDHAALAQHLQALLADDWLARIARVNDEDQYGIVVPRHLDERFVTAYDERPFGESTAITQAYFNNDQAFRDALINLFQRHSHAWFNTTRPADEAATVAGETVASTAERSPSTPTPPETPTADEDTSRNAAAPQAVDTDPPALSELTQQILHAQRQTVVLDDRLPRDGVLGVLTRIQHSELDPRIHLAARVARRLLTTDVASSPSQGGAKLGQQFTNSEATTSDFEYRLRAIDAIAEALDAEELGEEPTARGRPGGHAPGETIATSLRTAVASARAVVAGTDASTTTEASDREAASAPVTTGNTAPGPAAQPGPSVPVIAHDEDGTVVRGTQRGDTTLRETLRKHGFRWSRRQQLWYLPSTWRQATRSERVRELVGNLREQQRPFHLDDGTPNPAPTASGAPDFQSVQISHTALAERPLPSATRFLDADRRPIVSYRRIATRGDDTPTNITGPDLTVGTTPDTTPAAVSTAEADLGQAGTVTQQEPSTPSFTEAEIAQFGLLVGASSSVDSRYVTQTVSPTAPLAYRRLEPRASPDEYRQPASGAAPTPHRDRSAKTGRQAARELLHAAREDLGQRYPDARNAVDRIADDLASDTGDPAPTGPEPAEPDLPAVAADAKHAPTYSETEGEGQLALLPEPEPDQPERWPVFTPDPGVRRPPAEDRAHAADLLALHDDELTDRWDLLVELAGQRGFLVQRTGNEIRVPEPGVLDVSSGLDTRRAVGELEMMLAWQQAGTDEPELGQVPRALRDGQLPALQLSVDTAADGLPSLQDSTATVEWAVDRLDYTWQPGTPRSIRGVMSLHNVLKQGLTRTGWDVFVHRDARFLLNEQTGELTVPARDTPGYDMNTLVVDLAETFVQRLARRRTEIATNTTPQQDESAERAAIDEPAQAAPVTEQRETDEPVAEATSADNADSAAQMAITVPDGEAAVPAATQAVPGEIDLALLDEHTAEFPDLARVWAGIRPAARSGAVNLGVTLHEHTPGPDEDVVFSYGLHWLDGQDTRVESGRYVPLRRFATAEAALQAASEHLQQWDTLGGFADPELDAHIDARIDTADAELDPDAAGPSWPPEYTTQQADQWAEFYRDVAIEVEDQPHWRLGGYPAWTIPPAELPLLLESMVTAAQTGSDRRWPPHLNAGGVELTFTRTEHPDTAVWVAARARKSTQHFAVPAGDSGNEIRHVIEHALADPIRRSAHARRSAATDSGTEHTPEQLSDSTRAAASNAEPGLFEVPGNPTSQADANTGHDPEAQQSPTKSEPAEQDTSTADSAAQEVQQVRVEPADQQRGTSAHDAQEVAMADDSADATSTPDTGEAQPNTAEPVSASRVWPTPDTGEAELDRLARVNAAAAAYFAAELDHSPTARGYLTSHDRLGSSEAVDAVRQRVLVGYGPRDWTGLIEHVRQAGFSDADMLDAGVATRSRTGDVITAFYDRIVFGIRDEHGRLAGFTGRDLSGQAQAKYRNTAQTDLYRKSELLLGAAEQHEQLATASTVVLCEGPFDAAAIMATADEAGRSDLVAVAACGTAVTEQHLQLLDAAMHPQATLVIAADNDDNQAGRRNGLATVEQALVTTTRPIAYAEPPEAGHDPASWAAQHGSACLQLFTTDAQPGLLTLISDLTDGRRAGETSVEQSIYAAEDCVDLLARFDLTGPRGPELAAPIAEAARTLHDPSRMMEILEHRQSGLTAAEAIRVEPASETADEFDALADLEAPADAATEEPAATATPEQDGTDPFQPPHQATDPPTAAADPGSEDALLAAVSPLALRHYLTSTGWIDTDTTVSDRARVFTAVIDGAPANVLVPTKPQQSTYPQLVAELIDDLAAHTGHARGDILADLASGGGQPTSAGTAETPRTQSAAAAEPAEQAASIPAPAEQAAQPATDTRSSGPSVETVEPAAVDQVVSSQPSSDTRQMVLHYSRQHGLLLYGTAYGDQISNHLQLARAHGHSVGSWKWDGKHTAPDGTPGVWHGQHDPQQPLATADTVHTMQQTALALTGTGLPIVLDVADNEATDDAIHQLGIHPAQDATATDPDTHTPTSHPWSDSHHQQWETTHRYGYPSDGRNALVEIADIDQQWVMRARARLDGHTLDVRISFDHQERAVDIAERLQANPGMLPRFARDTVTTGLATAHVDGQPLPHVNTWQALDQALSQPAPHTATPSRAPQSAPAATRTMSAPTKPPAAAATPPRQPAPQSR